MLTQHFGPIKPNRSADKFLPGSNGGIPSPLRLREAALSGVHHRLFLVR